MRENNHSGRKKLAVLVLSGLTLFGAFQVFFPMNASAVKVNITGLNEGYDQGQQIEIIADIFIENGERIPINYTELQIAGPMFVNTTYKANGTPISSPPWITITLLSIQGQDPGYGYGYGSYDDYYNYDYGYRYGYDYDDSAAYDFGYGYGYIGRLKYKITIDTNYLTIGNYTAQLHVYTGSAIHNKFSSEIRPFAIWPVGESGKSWPQFQNNPAHTGYSTSEAPDYDYLVWEKPNNSYYMTVISNEKVISRRENSIYCYDEETGTLLWNYNAPDYVSPVPAISNNKVFFTTCWYNSSYGGWWGSLRCLSLDNGSLLWTGLDSSHSDLAYNSLTVADGRIFVCDYYTLYCVDENDGSLFWSRSGTSISSDAPLVYQGKVFLRTNYEYYISCIDEITGQMKWNKYYNRVSSPLSLTDGKIFFGYRNSIMCVNATNGDTLWTFPTYSSHSYSPTLAYGNVYFFNREFNASTGSADNYLYCLNQTIGTLNWKYKRDTSVYHSPAVADGKVYFGDSSCIFNCVDTFNGSLLWNRQLYPVQESLYAPAIANGKVFVANYYCLYCFGLDKYPPEHSNEYPPVNGRTNQLQPQIYVDVTDQYLDESSIRMKIDGISVFYTKEPINEGFRISYTPVTPYVDGQGVTVEIIAEDVFGNELDFSWWFIVDLTRPTAISYFPTGTSVSVNTDIRIEFSEPMDQNYTQSQFFISPSNNGSLSWSGNIIIFTPGQPLLYNQNYQIGVWGRDVAGNYLYEGVYWTFITEVPELNPPTHSNESPFGACFEPRPTVYVWVMDVSGVDQSTIRLYIDNVSVFYELQAVTDGFNVSYYCEAGFESYQVVTCRIVADDIYRNHLDFNWTFRVNTTTYFVIPLDQGWNLISIPLTPYNNSVGYVLRSIPGKWDIIRSCVQSQYGDYIWKTNITNRPESLNDLTIIDNKMALWIHITQPGGAILNVTGGEPVRTSITLRSGWNFIGYPTLNATRTIQQALATTGYDAVEGYSSTDPYLLQQLPSNYIMKPGEGYWVHVPSDSVWVIDW